MGKGQSGGLGKSYQDSTLNTMVVGNHYKVFRKGKWYDQLYALERLF